MAKKIIDRNGFPSSSLPKSSKTRRPPKLKTSTSPNKTQFKCKKCANCSKHRQSNRKYITEDLFGQAYNFSGVHGLGAAGAVCRSNFIEPKTSLLQQPRLNPSGPLTTREPLEMGHFGCNNPPQYVSYAPNLFNTSISCSNNTNNSSTPFASYDSNPMMMKEGMGQPQTLNLFPIAKVKNSTSAFKGLKKNKKVGSGAITVASNGEVDLELRLWF